MVLMNVMGAGVEKRQKGRKEDKGGGGKETRLSIMHRREESEVTGNSRLDREGFGFLAKEHGFHVADRKILNSKTELAVTIWPRHKTEPAVVCNEVHTQ